MKKAGEKIKFHYLYRISYFPQRELLKSFILKLLQREGKTTECINYIFCNDAYLHAMNMEYLTHDTLTDIITFELSAKGRPLLADIYISVDRVKENATIYGVPFLNELHRVVFHGALHLCGFKDKSNNERKLMRLKEDEALALYSVSRKTVSR